jgi:acetylornithine deacetylase
MVSPQKVNDAVRAVLDEVDVDRVVRLVQEVCRIPSVLGDEGPLAQYLASVMSESDAGFTDVRLQPVLPDRPNAIGEVRLGEGPRIVMTGHMDTKPVSHGWAVSTPFSGDLIDGAVYGHGVMDMKAALVCQIVAIEAVTRAGLGGGTLAMAAVSDHMGEQLGSIAYFKEYDADLCVLGELTDNQVCIGHRGRYYFDVTALGRSAHTCHKHLAVNANVLAAQLVLAFDHSKLEPGHLPEWVVRLFGPETFMAPGRIYGGLAPGGPSMIPDECVIRVDCRPQPGVTVEEVREEIDRCVAEATRVDPRVVASIELVDVKPGYVADEGSEVVRLMSEAYESVNGVPPTIVAENWLGDTASFGAQVPTVIFGPGGTPVYCPDEHLSVEDIVEATNVYAAFSALALTGGEGRP